MFEPVSPSFIVVFVIDEIRLAIQNCFEFISASIISINEICTWERAIEKQLKQLGISHVASYFNVVSMYEYYVILNYFCLTNL